MNQQRILSDYEVFGTNFGFCGECCKLDKPYCTECLFNYCSQKYDMEILLDSDLIFKDEVEFCGLLDSKVFQYNLWLWLNRVEDVFIGVYDWILINWDIAKENYFDMLDWMIE